MTIYISTMNNSISDMKNETENIANSGFLTFVLKVNNVKNRFDIPTIFSLFGSFPPMFPDVIK